MNWPVIMLSIGLAHAEPVAIHTAAGRIDLDAPVTCDLSAFGNSEIEIRWLAPEDQSVPLVVRQITSSRSVKRLTTTVDFKDGDALWKWPVPPVRGIARYRVELGTKPPVVLTVTAFEKKAHDAAWKALGKATVTATGVSPDNRAALSKLGLKVTTGPGDTTSLHLESPDLPARKILFQDHDPSKTVWIATPTRQGTGWKVIAPLSFIDPEALATDEGRIRLLSLLTDDPQTTSLP